MTSSSNPARTSNLRPLVLLGIVSAIVVAIVGALILDRHHVQLFGRPRLWIPVASTVGFLALLLLAGAIEGLHRRRGAITEHPAGGRAYESASTPIPAGAPATGRTRRSRLAAAAWPYLVLAGLWFVTLFFFTRWETWVHLGLGAACLAVAWQRWRDHRHQASEPAAPAPPLQGPPPQEPTPAAASPTRTDRETPQA